MVSATCAPVRQLNRIKRDLFGSAKTNQLPENKTPFGAELERHQELATQKWGFDFRSGCPVVPEKTHFVWERVSFQESSFAPEMYTLTRAAHVRPRAEDPSSDMDLLMNERAEREHFGINSSMESQTDNDSCYDSQDESPLHLPSSNLRSSPRRSATGQRKRQLKITEFMKERKRLIQAPKKLTPAKRLRSSSPTSSTSSTAIMAGILKRPRHN
ncbi:cyclin-dependent kinase inhibitor 1 [Drosophila tropicalis]|uniref:cyclin-dependent kinase inhibitor 1 n=1 Tax=Drosophila tropicalis TaxID=46794 RepID=UPI0035ABF3B1